MPAFIVVMSMPAYIILLVKLFTLLKIVLVLVRFPMSLGNAQQLEH